MENKTMTAENRTAMACKKCGEQEVDQTQFICEKCGYDNYEDAKKMTAGTNATTKNHQELMDSAYSRWEQNEGMSVRQFYFSLPLIERKAVVLGNFNYQVCNGGFSQWKCNDYMELHILELKEILDSMGGTTAKKVKNLVLGFENLDEEEQDGSDREAELCDRYYEIEEAFLKECEAYLQRLQIEGGDF